MAGIVAHRTGTMGGVRIVLLLGLAAFALWPARARGYVIIDPNAPVATTPSPGNQVPRAEVPANVQEIGPKELERGATRTLEETLAREVPGASTTDTQGNALNATLNLRGYTASPVLGSPQGVAVYQGGQRMN